MRNLIRADPTGEENEVERCRRVREELHRRFPSLAAYCEHLSRIKRKRPAPRANHRKRVAV